MRTRGYTVHVGKIDDLKIDFIAERRGKRMYIQLAYLLPDTRTIDREFAPLEKIQDNYPKFVLTFDEFQNIERNGMYTKYLLDFLLEKP
ncbi:MAG: ATP-binding protein [Treponema sp.]|nr:ATP-binding protein [Treponema sp.]